MGPPSTRGLAVPMMRYSFGSLSGTSLGTGNAAAFSTSAPYSILREDFLGSTPLPPIALHSLGGTPHVCAAAVMSISRAVAPAFRSGSQELRTLSLPPVVMSPYFISEVATACSILIFDQ